MDDCVFCKIVAGDIPASKVYEDDKVMSFMTIEAINPGHLLVIPKRHIESVWEMEDDLYQHAMMVFKKLAKALDRAFSPKKIGIIVSGWEVMHAHIHLVPQDEPKDITSKKLLEGTAFHFDPKTLDEHATKIKKELE